MAITIGEKLRLAREERGISLRDISEQTRISMRYLEAIETDDYKRLPGGIFNRSFIKSYARYIGFDEKEAIEAYASTMRQKGESAEEPTTLPKSLVYTDANSTRSPLVTLLLAIIILGVLSLGAIAALHWYQRRTAPRGSTEPGTSVRLMTAATAERCQPGGRDRQTLPLPGEVCSTC
jgi:cytoskeletal protein RodZ